MADTAYVDRSTQAAPKNYTLAASQLLAVKAIRASLDGTGAGTAFLPALQMVAPDGTVMWTSVPASTIAAGGSADATWFPNVGGQVGGSSVLPIQPAFSGNTIVPSAIIVGTRATQPAPASFGSAGAHVGFRTIITKTGTLHDLAVYCGSPAAGSVEVAILSTNTPTRQILYKTGFVAIAAGSAWQIIGDPALPVTLGDQYDIAFCSSASQKVLWFGGLVGSGSTDAQSGQLPDNFIPAPLGAPPKLTWSDVTSPRPYGATTTVDEASLSGQVGVPLVIGRIV